MATRKKATKLEVMTPEHARWGEFVTRLGGPEGCNFKEDEKKGITWTCAGGDNKSLATAILEKMGGFDIPASLAYFEQFGGHCDCEIVFNVDR